MGIGIKKKRKKTEHRRFGKRDKYCYCNKHGTKGKKLSEDEIIVEKLMKIKRLKLVSGCA